MRLKFRIVSSLKIILAICLLSNAVNAQTSSDSITKVVLQKDSLFWTAYNNCDIDNMMQYVTDDVEFYHDKNGVLKGKDNFRIAFQKNLCSDNDYRLRREPVKNSVSYFSHEKCDTLYGAVISGEHLFYVSQTGKERKT